MFKFLFQSMIMPIMAAALQQVADPLSLAWQNFESERYNACIRNGELAARHDPTNAEPHTVLGRCYERIGKFEMAHREFQVASALDPKDRELFYSRAALSLKLLSCKQNKKDLKDWAAHFPDDARIDDIRKLYQGGIEEAKKNGMGLKKVRAIIKSSYLEGVREKHNSPPKRR